MMKKLLVLLLAAAMLALCVPVSFAEEIFPTSGDLTRAEAVSYGQWEKMEGPAVLVFEFFSNGAFTAAVYNGGRELYTMPGVYRVTGSRLEIYNIGADGVIVNTVSEVSLNGDVLTIDGSEYYRRSAEAVAAGELMGTWRVTGGGGSAFGMPDGAELYFSFSDTTMNVYTEYGGQTSDVNIPYRLEGGRIVLLENGAGFMGSEMSFRVDGDTLELVENGKSILLTRVESAAD